MSTTHYRVGEKLPDPAVVGEGLRLGIQQDGSLMLVGAIQGPSQQEIREWRRTAIADDCDDDPGGSAPVDHPGNANGESAEFDMDDSAGDDVPAARGV